MANPVKVVLVGLGKMGRNHLRVLRETPRFDVVAVVDPDTSTWPAADAVGIKKIYKNFWEARGFHAAVVVSPSASHCKIAAEFANNGFPTLVEKPLALTAKEAVKLAGWGNKVVVGHIERFNPAVAALRKLLATGASGKLETVTARRLGGPPPAAPVSIVLDLAIHDIDVCRWLLGPLRIDSALCDAVRARVSFFTTGGVSVFAEADWISPVKTRTLVLNGETWRGQLDYQAQTLLVNGTEVQIEKDEPLRAELDAFATFVETGYAGDLCTAAEGAAAVQLAERAISPQEYI